ncbi:MAG: peptidoglycan-binding protein [Clostridia bacterium]|nr:peptidoglycan-binding protein [Clostridia bacterium]
MKRISILFFFICFLFLLFSACAETVLWEDENGKVLLNDNGEVNFISADGNNLGSVSSNSLDTFIASDEELTVHSPYETLSPGNSPVPDATPFPYDENDFPEYSFSPESVEQSSQTFQFTKALRYGDSGDLVSALQSRLKELGYYDARVSGGYYKVTRNAVRAFQSQNGLHVDGIAGQETQEMLFSAVAVPVNASPLPSPTPVPPKYTLMVDVTNQITRAYTYDETGNYTVLVREMICSTGTLRNPTPLGTTIMPKTRARWGYFPTWDSHAQYLTRIDKANAFHSVLYTAPNEQSLSVSSFTSLGTRQSHGCVRLTVSDAKWIYDNCEAGTIITVFESNIYDPEYTMTLKPALNQETLREMPLPAPTPLPVYSPENWPTRYRTLNRGSNGQDVYMLQMRLRELGFYNGTVSGGYYGGTIEAVKAFQQAAGLKVDGIAGKQTQSALFALTTPAPDVTTAPTPTPLPVYITPDPTPTPEPAAYTPVNDTVG